MKVGRTVIGGALLLLAGPVGGCDRHADFRKPVPKGARITLQPTAPTTPPATASAPAPAPAPATVTAPAPPSVPAAAAVRAPAPAPPPATVRAPAPAPARQVGQAHTPAASIASGAVDLNDPKELERNPGATPSLEQVSVKPGPAHPSIEGKPGPSPGIGPDDAPVKVFIFSDFQCPVCRRVVEPVKKLAREYGGKVQIIFKQNALKMHRQAELAAAASMAAFRQGRFWEFHDKVFVDQRQLQRSDLLTIARGLKLDMQRFEKDLDDPTLRAQIAYERDLAAKIGATGTPGFFINGQLLRGWGSYGGFKSMVDRALRATEKLPPSVARKDVAIEASIAHGETGKQFAELYWGRK